MKIRGKILFLAGVLVALGAGWAGFPRVDLPDAGRSRWTSVIRSTPTRPARNARTATRSAKTVTFAGIPPLAQCAGCHAAPMGTTAAEKKFIEQYVTPNREPQWLAYARQPENVLFSHAAHVKLAQAAMRAVPRAIRARRDKLPAASRRTASAATRATSGEPRAPG